MKKHLTWPLAAVLIAYGGMATAIAIWAPEDVRSSLLATDGLVAAIILYYVRSPRDRRGGES